MPEQTVEQWFESQGYKPAPFQRQLWRSYNAGNNGLLIAPTGAGKTYALIGAVIKQAQKRAAQTTNRTATRPATAAAHPARKPRSTKRRPSVLRVLWITPLRALAADIAGSIQQLCDGVGLQWQVELRTGDTGSSVKARQRKQLPEVLVTTPESLHVMFSYPGNSTLFERVDCIVVDEWHDLLGSKRGVMMQLALAHIRSMAPDVHVWGMSATIGNTEQAMDVLLAAQTRPRQLVRDSRKKRLVVETVLPDTIERFPWAGHMGDILLPKVLAIVQRSRSTLVFTNTRNQAETWYRKLLAADRDLAGQLALHHGSLSQDQRSWVESALHGGRLKAVICTSSLDLGVDFRPVDTVVQIGGPKIQARFLQRAGRSGHAPGETSRIYFVPTNSLELFEAAALKKAIKDGVTEEILPPQHSLDVLVQWLVTIATGDGFIPMSMQTILQATHAFRDLPDDEWQWALHFVTGGGAALGNYPEYRKLAPDENGVMRVQTKDIASRHRLSIGAIVSSGALPVQVLRGSVLGSLDETFAASLQKDQTFWFSGRPLQFVRLRDNTVWVRASKLRRGITPAWSGGRLPLSGQLAALIRTEVAAAACKQLDGPELRSLEPLSELQRRWSRLPRLTELLVEQYTSRDGHHVIIYPFEGRAIHEIIAVLLASRLGVEPNSFSFAFNDYGFELLAAKPIVLTEDNLKNLLTPDNLAADVATAIASGSLARRQFRSIAVIAGLVTKGRPGKPQSNRHLQASSELIYDVLRQYDSDNKLISQAAEEVLQQVVDIDRLQQTLRRMTAGSVVMTYPPHPTPLAFSLLTERLRERLSTEKLHDRLERMQAQLERYAG